VPAHAQVPDVIEEDDAGRAGRVRRRAEQGGDEDVRAARLVDDGAAEGNVPGPQQVEPGGERPGPQVRPAVDHDAGRFAAGVRVHNANPPGRAHLVTLSRPGRVAMPRRMTARTASRSAPSSGSRGARTVSEPRPHSAMASLMYCTSLTWVSRWSSGVNQR